MMSVMEVKAAMLPGALQNNASRNTLEQCFQEHSRTMLPGLLQNNTFGVLL